jgi:hypothetical protein
MRARAIGLILCKRRLRSTRPRPRRFARSWSPYAKSDRRSVARMVRYRLVVDAGGMSVPIVDQATLLKLWDVAFPPDVRCFIEQSAVPRPGRARDMRDLR